MGQTENLNPAQERTLNVVRGGDSVRPTHAFDLGESLRSRLEHDLAEVAAEVGDRGGLDLNKHTLSSVHGCEALFLEDDAAPFVVELKKTIGAVAHKAIELGLNWKGPPNPGDLVDVAIQRLQEDDKWMSEWLRCASDADRAELRSQANDHVVKFQDQWPPLSTRWRPAFESSRRVELCDRRITLRGKVDLVIGEVNGTKSGKVLIDLKTGRFSPDHVQDLRFYALLETLCQGVPPFRVASHYLESGELDYEDVDTDALDSAMARTVEGAWKVVQLRREQLAPERKPGPPCMWCALSADCDEGQLWLTDETRGSC